MTIRIKKIIRTDQWIVFIFIWKLFNRVELRDKINVIKHNRVITMFRLVHCILNFGQYYDY